jgi:UDP-2,3-diacylglucosamine hydrolase
MIISKRIEHSSFHDNQEYTFGDKTFLIGHGDGKVLEIRVQTHEKVFTNPFSNGF